MEKIIPSILGFTFGFILSVCVFGTKEGISGILPNIRFTIGNIYFSPHHWFVYMFIVLGLQILQTKFNIFPKYIYYFLISFFIGTINQGLLYKDWFVWFKKI